MKPVRCSGWLLAVALWSCPTGAWAFDGILHGSDECAPNTHHRRCEWDAVHQRAKLLNKLGCSGLAHYSERLRGMTNARYLSIYNGPLAGVVPQPAAAASASGAAPASPESSATPTDTDAKTPSTEPNNPPPPPTGADDHDHPGEKGVESTPDKPAATDADASAGAPR